MVSPNRRSRLGEESTTSCIRPGVVYCPSTNTKITDGNLLILDLFKLGMASTWGEMGKRLVALILGCRKHGVSHC